MGPIIGQLSRHTRVVHVTIVLAAGMAAALLAILPEGVPLRKVVSTVLAVLTVLLIIQQIVEGRPPGGRVSYGIPYAITAAASILMIISHSMRGPVVTLSSEISGLLFAIAIIMVGFQILRLPRSPDD